MSLIVGIGSNLGNPIEQLKICRKLLAQKFYEEDASALFESQAFDETDQPTFYNQVLQYKLPLLTPEQTLQEILNLELEQGRVRTHKWGPRIIDIDIIFFGQLCLNKDELKIPHPLWKERSFVCRPFMQIKYYREHKQRFSSNLPSKFHVEASPIADTIE